MKRSSTVGAWVRREHPWLDDLEPFVAQGVTLDTLGEWHETTGMPVVATYGGKGGERVGESPGMPVIEMSPFDSASHRCEGWRVI